MTVVSFGSTEERNYAPGGIHPMRFVGLDGPVEFPKYDEPDVLVEKYIARFAVNGGERDGAEAAYFVPVPKGKVHPKSNMAKLVGWLSGGPCSC